MEKGWNRCKIFEMNCVKYHHSIMSNGLIKGSVMQFALPGRAI